MDPKRKEKQLGQRPNKKLQRLPKDVRVHKRPLLHPPIPSPYASAKQQKVVYISPSTPFISAVKRARKLLEQVEKRAAPIKPVIPDKEHGDLLQNAREELASPQRKEEEIVLKATGRSIERALSLALFFQEQNDVNVKIRTGSVGVIDDIEPSLHGEETSSTDVKDGDTNGPVSADPLPESRIRQTSVVEVALTWS